MFGYMILPYKRYFDIHGRSRRMEFWMFQLFFWAVLSAILLIGGYVTGVDIAGLEHDPTGMALWFRRVLVIFWLASLSPAFAVSVRRLHDQDKSGMWLLWVALGGIGVIILAVIMMLKGDEGENLYGYDPRLGESSDDIEVFA